MDGLERMAMHYRLLGSLNSWLGWKGSVNYTPRPSWPGGKGDAIPAGPCWSGYVSRHAAISIAALAAIALWYPNDLYATAQETDAAEPAVEIPAEESPDNEKIQNWIAQLSHDAYAMREAAAEKLMEAGSAAREPLLAFIDAPDPEMRAAARRLVALIDRTEFQRRLEAFALDVDGRKGLTLPGWKEFRNLAGDDPSARALFVEMQRQEAAMLAAAYGVSAKPPTELWEDRLMRVVQWQATVENRAAAPPLGSCATMLFLGSTGDIEVSDRGALLVEHLIQRPPIRDVLQTGNYRATVRRLVVGWILDCPNRNETLLGNRIRLASINELKEALPLALAVIGGEEKYASVQPATKAAALLFIGQFGDREHIARVEPLLADPTICLSRVAQLPGQQAGNVQVRDVALVVLLTLTEQRPADYGYVHARMQAQKIYQVQTLHLGSDAERDAAVAKWRTWRTAEQDRERKFEKDGDP